MKSRRYLTHYAPKQVLHRFTDIIVIGAGIAGLRAAIKIAEDTDLSVIVLSKGKLNESNSDKAQGGIAAVFEAAKTGDSEEAHVEDTLAAGGGLADPGIVSLTVHEGIERIRELIQWGVQFDRHQDELDYTQEGGHSKPRILHAHGDSTGHEIIRGLLARAKSFPQIKILENAFAVDLLVSDKRCVGVLAVENHSGKVAIWARSVILASGGYGRLFRETTNGPLTTGDGIAMAYRAGAALQNLEFIQFHPTTLYIAGAERYLITEAARGEGGILKDHSGNRFMDQYHPMAELAPRDVVSRAILDRISKTHHPMVYLDLTMLGGDKLKKRFPGIVSICTQFDINPAQEPIPVRPSAHYTIGGVKSDAWGQTTLAGLFACGEVACTGLHGANRLGSNSLLEGLVFGFRSARKAAEFAADVPCPTCPSELTIAVRHARKSIDVDDMRRSLENLMVRDVGILRDEARLSEAAGSLKRWVDNISDSQFSGRADWEVQNMVLVALLIAESASWRRESRGTHFRTDFPEAHPTFARNSMLTVNRE